MKALYSGVSGMRSHQTKMDVIGNNIANVNTNGYKSQRTTFRDVYYQQIKSPTNPGDDGAGTVRGGTNSAQVGYGAQVGSIDTIHTLSGYTPTNKQTDVYINGEGYIKVQTPNKDTFYTRMGALSFDQDGNLVDINGSSVMGWNITGYGTAPEFVPVYEDGKTDDPREVSPLIIANFKDFKNITINADGTISGTTKVDLTTPAAPADTIVTIGQIAIANIPNNNALILEGNSYYRAGNNAGDITYEEPGTGGTGALVTGGLEMSNVDLANEFSEMIVTQRGFQANTKIISVVDQMLEELVNLKR